MTVEAFPSAICRHVETSAILLINLLLLGELFKV